MDVFCTVEERYIRAAEELNYGDPAKALQLLNEIIAVDENYARGYYLLGVIHFTFLKAYQNAGYYFNKCIELDPDFTEAYHEFMRLLVLLQMSKKANHLAEKALKVHGIDSWLIYQQLGLLEEKKLNWKGALSAYGKAFTFALIKEELDESNESLTRIKAKRTNEEKYVYSF